MAITIRLYLDINDRHALRHFHPSVEEEHSDIQLSFLPINYPLQENESLVAHDYNRVFVRGRMCVCVWGIVFFFFWWERERRVRVCGPFIRLMRDI